MLKKSLLILCLSFFAISDVIAAGCLVVTDDPQLCETKEILYASGESVTVAQKASELGSAVKIYEYLRNNSEYTAYHGARSSSLNTALSMRGNDVDLASTLIAMLRSQGIKARYVVGDIKLQRAELVNWLGVVDSDLAISILRNQGIQNIENSGPSAVIFQHVWAEALVDYDNYRAGNTVTPVNCTVEGGACKWIPLDVSYKQKSYKNESRMLLRNLNFDYDAYYHAENPINASYQAGMKNKNPLEIFEEQALAYLRTNHPGVTLEDVIDKGETIRDESGLLPASMPYEVVGTLARYDTVEDYDIANPALTWTKYLTSQMALPGCAAGGFLPSYTVSLAELSTKKLTLTMFIDGTTKIFAHRLDGVQVGSSISASGTVNFICGGINTVVEVGMLMNVDLEMDAAPDGPPITTTYENLTFGGYYLIASGGETSNWTQVKRAYTDLLAANQQYPILVDGSGEVFVDENDNGIIDSVVDTPLLNHLEAQDALTGGLLYVAQSIYYTRLREESERYSRLKGIISPVAGYLGIVSTTHEVEYLNDVPFAVTPGGLLIDLKGIRINGSWEIDQPEIYSNETFRFLGHQASSLEHEVWQEITGYDAISTMRGIQMALSNGKNLLDVNYNPPANTFPAAIFDLGFSAAPSADFTQNQRALFSRELVTWAYLGSDSNPGFNAVLPDASALVPTDNRAAWLSYGGNNGLDAYVGNIDNLENQLLSLAAGEGQLKVVDYTISGLTGRTVVSAFITSPSSGFTVDSFVKLDEDNWRFTVRETAQHPDGVMNLTLTIFFSNLASATAGLTMNVSDDNMSVSMTCSGIPYSGIPSQLLVDLENCFDTAISEAGLTATVDFLDVNKGFNPGSHAYRSYNLGVDEYSLGFMQTLRSSMYFMVNPDAWSQYLLPTRFSQGPYYLFNVYIKNTYLIDDLVSSTYAIVNHSNRLASGGGYVTAEETTDPAISTEFNNEVFTDLNLVSVTNNDVVRTPSTADPVSTVTGNMYHDETDIVIKGKGLNYAFTRTYNSDQTKTPTASNLPLSKGWTHSYNMRLIANDHGQFPNYTATQAPENNNGMTSSITYVDERGGESNYLLDDTGASWAVTPPRMSFDQLQLDVPAIGSYTLTFRNGVKYIFQGADLKVPGNSAQLSRIEDPYGNQLNFTYSNGQLMGISDNTGIAGRTGLILSYYPAGNANAGHLQNVSDWTGRSWTYQYTDGQLASVTNPLADAMTYSYHPDTDLLKDIVSPENRAGKQKTTTFSYYENDQAYSYIDQLGSIELLTYDLFRKRTRITNPRGFITEHYYDENGALIKLVEPDKGILLFENNADGLRYLKRDALGNTTTYSYNNARTLTGEATNTFGQVTREQDALGNTVDYSYGILDQITDVKNKNNIHTVNEYYTTTNTTSGALLGKLHRVIMPQAIVNGVVHSNVVIAQYQYNSDGTVKHIEEWLDPAQPARKRITDLTYAYDATGYTLTRILSGATSGNTVTTEQRYDALWRLQTETIFRRTSATDTTLLALVNRYEYDGLNRPTKMTDALGNITETIYDRNGQVSQITRRYALTGSDDRPIHTNCTIDAAYPGHHSCIVTTRHYDAADRLSSESNINGETVSYEYDAMGNVTKITNAQGHGLYNEYDKKGRLTRITNENGYSVQSQYDLAGRLIATIDPNGNAMRYEYDAIGRGTKVTTPENRITLFDQYDGNGNLIKVRDANAVSGKQPVNSQGATQYKQYDEFNRVISESNAADETTAYHYDLLGNLTQITDAKGQITRFVYDDMGRLIEIIDPIIETPTDATKHYSYDEMGNILTHTDRNGEVVRSTYDGLNRKILIEFLADNTTQTATYNQYAELAAIANESVTYYYGYDNRQRMISKTDSRTGKRLEWRYDIAGNLASKIDYQGKETTFTYDNSNRLIAMANKDYLQASYHYDPAGRLLSRILSNGAATLYTYDKDSLLKKVTQRSANGDVIDERSFEHDDIGNIVVLIVGRVRNITTGYNIDYTYDPAYRLLTADSREDGHSYIYTYDAVGNRTSVIFDGGREYYIYDNTGNRLDEVRENRITGPVAKRYEYDANGSRVITRNGSGTILESYVYNQKRLVTQMTNGGETSIFAYDPNAYRIQKVTAADTRNYLLEAEHLEAVYDENDQLTTSYLRGVIVDEIINGFERDASGKLQNHSYHHDQVNSIIALTDHTGAMAQSKTYSPFGRGLTATGTSGNTLGYTGREFDGASGLYYYRARYYDPEVGRFLSEDPLGFEAGVNFYAYVSNNPLNFNDPFGESEFNVCPGCLIPIELFTETIPNFVDGVISLPIGVFHAADFGTQIAGLQGATMEMHAGNNLAIFNELSSQALANPSEAFDLAFDFAENNPAFVTGRILSGVGIGVASQNIIVSPTIGGLAGFGDAINAIDNGVRSLEGFIPALMGGEINTQFSPQSNNQFNFSPTGASGGFVLYPNKINTNFLQDVYAK